MTEPLIQIKIKRQNSPDSKPYWEEFALKNKPAANVISCLQEVTRNPVNRSGQTVHPVVWESNCLEEVCGSCTMVINGRVRQACTALVDQLEQPIVLEPMSKFPMIRDLQVDRSRMFENLKKVQAWIHIDGTHDIGKGPVIPEKQRFYNYEKIAERSRGLQVIRARDASEKWLFNPDPTSITHGEIPMKQPPNSKRRLRGSSERR